MPPKTAPRFVKRLLWVDCIGAGLVGIAVLTLSGWLSDLEGLPKGVLLFTGAMNLLYGAYSLSMAIRAIRPMWKIRLLVAANFAWVPVCLGLLIAFAGSASPFAYVHLGGEALYVGTLALLEWHNREHLTTR